MPDTLAHPATPTVNVAVAKPLYFALAERHVEPADSDAAAAWLRLQLERADRDGLHMPQGADAFAALAQARADTVAQQYQLYLAERKAGAARRYFHTKSQALYFLQAIAPTKLVDGSWLYGLLSRWRDPGVRPLITTYLEELGNGVPEKNHALIYRELLELHGCTNWADLSPEHFVQGLVQLTLAHHPSQFLPELIGYNLGYEQLPLHLLITAFELDEFDIDPYYFTLHISADNVDTGHARKAWEAAQKLLPQAGDSADFERRIANGYRLGDLGAGALSIIDDFDLYAELAQMLRNKAAAAPRLASEFCKIGGQSVPEWLEAGQPAAALMEALRQEGWIKPGEAAEDSRFWRLLHGETEPDALLFSPYEQQLLRDAIALSANGAVPSQPPRVATHRARQRLGHADENENARAALDHPQRSLIRHHFPADEHAWADIASELRLLEAQLAASVSKQEAIDLLTSLMSPASHHTPSGLMATRVFSRLFE
jgi:hypothetical protein